MWKLRNLENRGAAIINSQNSALTGIFSPLTICFLRKTPNHTSLVTNGQDNIYHSVRGSGQLQSYIANKDIFSGVINLTPLTISHLLLVK